MAGQKRTCFHIPQVVAAFPIVFYMGCVSAVEVPAGGVGDDPSSGWEVVWICDMHYAAQVKGDFYLCFRVDGDESLLIVMVVTVVVVAVHDAHADEGPVDILGGQDSRRVFQLEF